MPQEKAAPNAAVLAIGAWAATITAVRQMPLLFVTAAFLATLSKLMEMWAQTAPGVIPASWGDNWDYAATVGWIALSMFVKAAVLAPVAIAVHRSVLLGETARGRVHRKGPVVWRFVAWSLVITAVSGALSFPIYASDGSQIEALAWMLFGAGIVVISVRSLLLFPALAIGERAASWREQFETAWQRSGGHFWRMALALALAIGLFFAPFWLLTTLATFVLGWIGDVDTMATVGWGGEFLFSALAPFTVALAAAVASYVYRWVRANPHEKLVILPAGLTAARR